MTDKSVWYLAHPVTGDPRGNCTKVMAWLRFLMDRDPSRIFVAPWVAEVLAYADQEVGPDLYDRVLSDDEDVVRKLDGLILVGGKISTGMAREAHAAREACLPVCDWSDYKSPADVPALAVPHDTDNLPEEYL